MRVMPAAAKEAMDEDGQCGQNGNRFLHYCTDPIVLPSVRQKRARLIPFIGNRVKL
jgi:hypothetical protein